MRPHGTRGDRVTWFISQKISRAKRRVFYIVNYSKLLILVFSTTYHLAKNWLAKTYKLVRKASTLSY